MASVIATFFQKHLADHADEVDEHIKSRRARIAAAALLVEVVNADGEITAPERRSMLEGVQKQFSLSTEAAGDLIRMAEAQTAQTVDLHQFTSLINKQFTPAQKAELIEEFWRAAYADAVLHKYEEHLVRRIADLLYVPTGSVLSAKHRVQSAAQRTEK
jgi:uncharacterized tellurite resistance protein B-like protein